MERLEIFVRCAAAVHGVWDQGMRVRRVSGGVLSRGYDTRQRAIVGKMHVDFHEKAVVVV